MKSVLFPVLLLALVGAGCSDDETPLNPDEGGNYPQSLSIQASVLTSDAVSEGTRAIVYGTAFPNASQIGVHVAQGTSSDPSGNQGQPGVPYSTEYYTNQMFEFDGSVWTPDTDYHLSADKGTVYAYYPFDENAHFTAPGMDTVRVFIQPTGSITVQSGSAATDHINNSGAITAPVAAEKDFMFYRPVGNRAIVSNRQQTVTLTMQHALAQVSFRLIKASNYPGAGIFTRYEISDAGGKSLITTSATASVMSIVDGSITLDAPVKGTISREITNYQLGYELAEATIVSNLAYPVPTISAGDLTVVFHIDGEDYAAQLPVTAGTSDAWMAGKNYLYSVTLNGTGIEVTSVSITDWNNVDAGEIEIE